MQPSFATRRKARKVGQEEEEENMTLEPTTIGRSGDEQESTPTAIRPSTLPRGSSKSKKRSSLRISFGPGGTSMTEDDDGGTSAVFTPKKSNLSRQALEKNARRKALASTLSAEHLPFRQSEDRPSYSLDHLNELRSSTPSTPKDLKSLSDVEDLAGQTLDLESKFGSSLAGYQDSAIPTEAEIKEKKERRARLAREEYISLNDHDNENNETSLLPHKQTPNTRLVQDDEDIAEGFDEFVEDGRIAVGRKAQREQKRRHEAEIRDLINEAEGSEDDSDDSEAERKAAYEAAQTRAGMDGLQKDGLAANRYPPRPKTPPKITPLPSLNGCLERLRDSLNGIEHTRTQKVRRMEELEREKADIAAREVEIQELLREAGERYEKLRNEVEIGGEEKNVFHQGGREIMARRADMVS